MNGGKKEQALERTIEKWGIRNDLVNLQSKILPSPHPSSS